MIRTLWLWLLLCLRGIEDEIVETCGPQGEESDCEAIGRRSW